MNQCLSRYICSDSYCRTHHRNHALVTCPVVLALAIDRTNPSVISDLVGDMVVDCVGSSAHVFESAAAEIIGAISLAKKVAIESPVSFVFFPVVVHDFDIVVSSIGILCVTEPGPIESDPMTTLQRGYSITFLLVLAGFGLSTRWLLFSSAAPGAWLHFFHFGDVGMVTAYVFVKSAQYYTDYAYAPHGSYMGMPCSNLPTISVPISPALV
ncbi:hypothetical protein DYB28_004578 [Aphanomyces astaci]|uniref:H(+)-exporting diphosphatase n=1 Tax=Aphanomyces astaci TaxID=112090 RepID=A0A9X8H4H9_APHAT|nr:hypothetical protein DYB28_004578 [Aphanomyces astaci]